MGPPMAEVVRKVGISKMYQDQAAEIHVEVASFTFLVTDLKRTHATYDLKFLTGVFIQR